MLILVFVSLIFFKNNFKKHLHLKSETFNGNDFNISNINLTFNNFNSSNIIVEPFKSINITFSDSWMNNNQNLASGGSLRITNPIVYLTINNTYFNNSKIIGNGGGIYIDNHNHIILINSSFENNSATLNGGSIYSTNSQSINIKNTSIKNSKALGSGGSLYSSSNGNIIINDLFSENSSSNSNGGTIFSSSSNGKTIINNIITKNTSANSNGGSLCVNSYYGDILINNLTTENSKSTSYGGSLYLQSYYNIYLSSIIVKNSSSSSRGGTLFSTNTNLLSISSSIFENSNSTNFGGSAYISSYNSKIFSSIFKKSYSSLNGGCLYYVYSSSINEIIFCHFEECITNQNGGAIFISISSTFTISINESTFYKCRSIQSGGSFFINSSSLNIFLSKICISNSTIDTSGTTYLGNALYLGTNSNSNQQKIDLVSCSNCGKIGFGFGTIYQLYGQQNILSLNLSSNLAQKSSIGYFNPYSSSTYLYCNFFKCNSSTSDCLYLKSVGNFIDLDYTNIISNNGISYCIYFYYTLDITKFFIKYSIFHDNPASTYLLFSFNNYLQNLRNCYIKHQGNWGYGFTNENNIFSSYYTPTYLLTHYSTFLCNTPNELGILNLPQIPCQTLLPPPTSCLFETNNEQKNMKDIDYIPLYISLLLIIN